MLKGAASAMTDAEEGEFAAIYSDSKPKEQEDNEKVAQQKSSETEGVA